MMGSDSWPYGYTSSNTSTATTCTLADTTGSILVRGPYYNDYPAAPMRQRFTPPNERRTWWQRRSTGER